MKELIEGVHYYINDTGYVVLSEQYHRERGYCCGNGCLHCPFRYEAVPEPRRSQLLAREQTGSGASQNPGKRVDAICTETRPYLQGASDESQAQFSPDGLWVAYASTESGQPEVYVQPFPATGAKWQVSVGGGEQPRWRRDGKEVFYLAEDDSSVHANLRESKAQSAAKPEA